MNFFHPSEVQIGIVDDDAAMRDSLSCALSSAGYCSAAFAGAEEFWANFDLRRPHCVLIDLVMPGVNGLMLCRRLAAVTQLTTAFAVISGHAEVSVAVEAMKLGAIDVLEKPFGRQHLLDTVVRGIEKANSLRERMSESQNVRRKVAKLTPREQEILNAMSDGRITKEIAKLFGISARTVDVHRSRIMEKLELSSPAQLAHVIAILHRHRGERSMPNGPRLQELQAS